MNCVVCIPSLHDENSVRSSILACNKEASYLDSQTVSRLAVDLKIWSRNSEAVSGSRVVQL
jgi:hypothetical protein